MVDERPDDVDRLCSSSLFVQDVFQLGDLPSLEIRKVGVEFDLASVLRSFQLRIEITLAVFQFLQLVPNGARIAVTPKDKF